MRTYEDMVIAKEAGKLEEFIISVMDRHLATQVGEYNDLKSYYMGDDPKLRSMLRRLKYLNIDGVSVDLEPQLKITNNFGKKIINTIAGRLWSSPVRVRVGTENVHVDEVLGRDFVKTAKRIQKLAGVYGVCYGFYDNGNVVVFEPTGYVPLVCEDDGQEKAGIRFWRASNEKDKPWNVQLFEMDGYTWWKRGKENKATASPSVGSGVSSAERRGGSNPSDELWLFKEKRAYKRVTTPRGAGAVYSTVEDMNYPSFPVVPLYVNDERQSEFNQAVLSKIQAMNIKETLYMDETFRNPFIAWYLQGYGGDVRDLVKLKQMFQSFSFIADKGDPDEGKITPMTIDVPFEEHEASMRRLEDGIYRDAQIVNTRAMAGGSLTNVVIKAHMKEENTKMANVEMNTKEWVRQLLFVAGVEVSVDDVLFVHSTIINETEIHRDIVNLKNSGILTADIAAQITPILIENNLVDETRTAIGNHILDASF